MTHAQTTYCRFESPSGTPEEYAGYEVLDPAGQKIGSAEKLYFNGDGRPEYVRVRIGVLLIRHVLIPVRNAALDRAARSLKLK